MRLGVGRGLRVGGACTKGTSSTWRLDLLRGCAEVTDAESEAGKGGLGVCVNREPPGPPKASRKTRGEEV